MSGKKKYSGFKTLLHTLRYDLFLIYPIQFCISIIVARNLLVFEKGIQSFFTIIVVLIVPLSFFGYGHGLRYFLSKGELNLGAIIQKTLKIIAFLGFILSGAVVLLWYNDMLGPSGNLLTSTDICFLVFCLNMSLVTYIFNKILLGQSEFVLVNRVNGLYYVAQILLLCLFFFYFDFGLKGFIYAFTISKLFQLIVMVKPYFRLLREKYDGSAFTKVKKYGLRAYLNELVNLSNQRLDQFLIAFFVAPTSLGLYSIVIVISEICMRFPQSVSQIFYNKVARTKSSVDQKKILARISVISSLVCLALILGCALFSNYFIQLIFGDRYMGVYPILLFYLPGIFFNNILRVNLQFFSSTGRPEIGTRVLLYSLLASIPVYSYLLYKYDVKGASLGSSIVYLISAFWSFYYLFKKDNFSVKNYFMNKADVDWFLKLIKIR